MSEMLDRPSIVLQGFRGGIVHSSDIAMRLARIILAAYTGAGAALDLRTLAATDGGDRWSIASKDESAAGSVVIILRKRDAAFLSIGRPHPPDLLPDAAIAEKFAAVLAESAADAAAAVRQQPFTVTDGGETWRVRGNNNADRALDGPGPFRLEVRKQDARVLDMYFEMVLHTPPEVTGALRQR